MGGVARKRYDPLLAKEQQQKKRNPNANTNGLNEYEVKYHKKIPKYSGFFYTILYFYYSKEAK